MPFDVNKYPDLVRAIENKNLVLFVGAGLSYNLKNDTGEAIEGWNNLVKRIIEHKTNNGYDVGYLLPMVGKSAPIDILGQLEKDDNINKSIISQYVRDFYKLPVSNDYSLHKKLFLLSNKIITTNYDRALEISNEDLADNVAYKGKDPELMSHKDHRKPFLLKLHGCCRDANSMILFPSDYQDLYESKSRESEHVLTVLKNLAYNKTILFIGCGMGDFQINHIFKTVKELQKFGESHFIVSNGNLDSRLNFLKQIPIADYSEIPGVIEALINVKTEHESKKSPEVLAMENDLLKSNLRIKEIEEKLTKTMDDSLRKDLLIEKAALDYFDRGLEYQQDSKYEEACKEYKKSIEYNSKNYFTFNNWGNATFEIAKLKKDDTIFYQSFQLFEKAIELNHRYVFAFMNWGIGLSFFARLVVKNGSEFLLNESIKKYKKVIEIDKDNYIAYMHWGNALLELAKLKSDEALFRDSFIKFKKATTINNNYDIAFFNWGLSLLSLAQMKKDISLYQEASVNFEKVISINSNNILAYNVWSIALYELANLKKEINLYRQSIAMCKKAYSLNRKNYYTLYCWGNALSGLALFKKNIKLFEESCEMFEKAAALNQEDASVFNNWGNAIQELAILKKNPNLYYDCLLKYEIATKLDPIYSNAFNNWGAALFDLAKLNSDDKLLDQSIEKLLKAEELGGKSYNLSCAYALKNNKTKALESLKNSLQKKEIEANNIEKDEDWQAFWNDPDFIKIIDEFRLK